MVSSTVVYRAYFIVASMLCGCVVSPAQAQPTIIPIDNIPGTSLENKVTSLSADGTAVAGYSIRVENFTVFRWTLGGDSENLGNPAGGNFTIPRGISGNGSTIAVTDFVNGGINTAYRWTSGLGFQDIGALGSGGAIANGISADGSGIVGVSSDIAGGNRAFRWTGTDGIQNLGVLPGGTFSDARGISGNASVVVGTSDSEDGFRAFRWTSDGGMQSLGLLPGGSFSIGSAVSGDGTVATGFIGGRNEAYYWTESYGMQGIGFLPDQTFSEGLAVSGDGSAIVGFSGTDDGTAAFLWTAAGGMVDLNLYLPTLGIDLSGWTLERANGISADGRTIAGNGSFNGETRGWVVTGIPTPGTLTAFGLLGLATARRRRN